MRCRGRPKALPSPEQKVKLEQLALRATEAREATRERDLLAIELADADTPWEALAEALGTSPQAAWHQYSPRAKPRGEIRALRASLAPSADTAASRPPE